MTWRLQHGDTTQQGPTYQGRGYFLDRHHGWAAEYVGIRRTTDGGRIWSDFPGDGFGDLAWSVFFLDTLHGWSIGYLAELSKSEDGGASWISLDRSFEGLKLTSGFTSVFFRDTLNGWICDDQGGIIHTTDGGESWVIQGPDTLPGNHGLNSIFFINKNDGWAVGNGIVLHTTNGGGVTAVKGPRSAPTHFKLLQNYPNPFNPTTVIRFVVRSSGFVSLKVYDVLGREVATLVDGSESAGTHSVVFNGSKLASEVYFYRLAAPGINLVRKMLLEK